MSQYLYRFTPTSLKQFQKLTRPIQQRIITKLDYFCQTNPFLYAEKLTDHKLGEFRFRIGDWRVVFDQNPGKLITIRDVGHRREIYR